MALISNKIVPHLVSDRLQSMRENGIMLDLTVIVNRERKLRAHKLVLASVSAFFQEMFSNKANPIEIYEMNDCDFSAVEVLLDYAYNSLTHYDKRLHTRPLEVIDVAWRFQVTGLISFANENLTANSCLQAVENAKKDPQKSFCEASKKTLFDIWKSKLTFESWDSFNQLNNTNNDFIEIKSGNIKPTPQHATIKVETCSDSSDSGSDIDCDSKNIKSASKKPTISTQVTKSLPVVKKKAETSSEPSSDSSSESEDEKEKPSSTNKLNVTRMESQKQQVSNKTPKIGTIFRVCNYPHFSESAPVANRWLYLTIGADKDIFVNAVVVPCQPDTEQQVRLLIYNTSTCNIVYCEVATVLRKKGMINLDVTMQLRKPFLVSHKQPFYTFMMEYLLPPYFQPSPTKFKTSDNKISRLNGVRIRHSTAVILNNVLLESHSIPRIPLLFFSVCPSQSIDSKTKDITKREQIPPKLDSSDDSSDSDSSEDSNNCTKTIISPPAKSNSSASSIKKLTPTTKKKSDTSFSESSSSSSELESDSKKRKAVHVFKVDEIKKKVEGCESISSESSSESEEEDTKSKQSTKTQISKLQLEKLKVETQKRRLSSEKSLIKQKKSRNESCKDSKEKSVNSIHNPDNSGDIKCLSVSEKMPKISVHASSKSRWLYLTVGADTDILITGFHLPTETELRRVSVTFYSTIIVRPLTGRFGILTKKVGKKFGKFDLDTPFRLSRFYGYTTIMVEYLFPPYFEPVLNNAEIVRNKKSIQVPTAEGNVVFRFSTSAVINNALVEDHSFPRILKVFFKLSN